MQNMQIICDPSGCRLEWSIFVSFLSRCPKVSVLVVLDT